MSESYTWDDVPDETTIRYVSGVNAPTGQGSVTPLWGENSQSVPIGLTVTPQQRCEARLQARGIQIVRQVRGSRR